MGEFIDLTAADGHVLSAWREGPHDGAGLVVVQEIFGVNDHIRNVCSEFAAQGYSVIAPALFDRVERGVSMGYSDDDRARGIALARELSHDTALLDVEAAAATLPGPSARGIVGYCYGGTIAFLAAARSSSFNAAVGWYGGGIAAAREEPVSCPVQLHFGGDDYSIPASDVDLIRQAQPGIEIFVYPHAQHGFGCDERSSFSPSAATLAKKRTRDFFAHHLASGASR